MSTDYNAAVEATYTGERATWHRFTDAPDNGITRCVRCRQLFAIASFDPVPPCPGPPKAANAAPVATIDNAITQAIIASRRETMRAVHNAQLDVISRIEGALLALVGGTVTGAEASALTSAVEAVGRVKESVYEAGRAIERAMYDLEAGT